MSKYNIYAKKLDEAFKEARNKYKDLVDKLNKAEKAEQEFEAYCNSPYHNNPYSDVEFNVRQMRVRADLREAQDKLRVEGRQVWEEFEATRDKLGSELQAVFKHDNLAAPDAVDINGLELLKSGVLTVDDMEGLLAQYDTNPTMLKLVSKYAHEAAEAADDIKDQTRLNAVSHAARNKLGSVMQKWDDIVGVAKYCSGRAHAWNSVSPNYVLNMNKAWDKVSPEAIENF